VFIEITAEDTLDLPIPGKPFSFSVLKQAQALGDLQAIAKRDRPLVRLHITGDLQAGLAKIQAALADQTEKRL
jgi:transaldolase/glucose-6-phosphate isomerase